MSELSNQLNSAKSIFILPRDDVASEVISPAFAASKSVSIMMGFFSSGSLSEIAPGLAHYLRSSEEALRLIVSPFISDRDQEALRNGTENLESMSESLFAELLPNADELAAHTLSCLAWLIAKGRLELKIAVMRDALFHPKVWLFECESDRAVLHGSANMTGHGLGKNREQLSLAKNWKSDEGAETYMALASEFDTLWSGGDEDCITVPISRALREKIVKDFKGEREPDEKEFSRLWRKAHGLDEEQIDVAGMLKAQEGRSFAIPDWLEYRSGDYAHQGEAVDKWLEADCRGVLEMCTGSGKTLTAMIGAHHLYEREKSLLIVVSAPYNVLIGQWCDEIAQFGIKPVNMSRCSGPGQRASEIVNARRRLRRGVSAAEALVVSNDTLCTTEFIDQIAKHDGPKLLIADECHNLGAATFINDPPQCFQFRLGLSATPIRQYDEEGKTTLLTALQWGLIGEDALPPGYKLRPMDLPASEVVETKVEIEYEIENRDGRQRYLLERSVETKGDDRGRPKSNLNLFHIKDSGFDPENSPYNHIQQHFPAELREVFFTDGDRALSFIEGPRAEQQHKVRAAIEKMMGLSMLESTIDHIKTNEKKLRSRFDREAGNAETRKVEDELDEIDKKLPVLMQRIEQTQDEIANLNDKHQKADRELQEALKLGNREELAKELRDTQAQRKRVEEQRKKTEARQAELLSSSILAKHMMCKPFKKAGKILDELRQRGQIPNKTVPILEDRLTHSDCICGESLDSHTEDGKRRREHIENLIEDSRDADSIKAKVSDLYFQGRPLFSGKPESWTQLYSSAFEERQNIRSVYEEIGQREAELETKLNNIPDTDVQRLREIRETYSNKLRQLTMDGTRLDEEIKRKRSEKTELELKFRTLSARVEKGEKIARELSVATDMKNIVERSLERMRTLEVKQVSDTMNELFLKMIGADEESALITRAEITPEFRIVVFGRGDAIMDPSMDLNGASRRALTIAFVLALTEISGVEAPNVIDTPLGMMSGFVKSEVVRTASDNSAQLILFLTHDEIKGCEEILDTRAAEGLTLTNPAHYPRILKNDPGTKEVKVMSCGCDHNGSCKLCDRYENSTDAAREVA